ncbi:PH-like domain-containing protein [Phytoactinopolyspora halotolerans]|uniref:PH domain-containing protein n=1 Tax=Phytoactinopolyspora halotolerans TaxID=1981512 RepID=A0A6L9SG01_9ACTN|nr:hypothetical protein [Phytoactinopolyspora halotolerans]NEE04053.1 hypothetical protein [Phytoactinopolyspora halotolerans]
MTAVAVAILGLILVASYVSMWRGWRRRTHAHVDLPPLPSITEASSVHSTDAVSISESPADITVEASYAGTTTAGDWLERVVAHGLGRRSSVSITVDPSGIQLERGTEPSFSIPASSLRAVRIDRAGAGRAVRCGEYVIITWQHGDMELDTAVRPRHRDDRGRLVDAVAALGATARDRTDGADGRRNATARPEASQ